MKYTIYDIIDDLYTLNDYVCNNKDLSEITLPEEFMDLWLILFSHKDIKSSPSFVKKDYEKFHYIQRDKKKVTICYSGGLKSTALVIFYKRAGYDVILYHAKTEDGIKKRNLKYIANRLEAELVVDELDLKGGILDKMIISTNAIACTEHPSVAIGCYMSSDLSGNNFDEYGDMTREMWQAYSKIIKPLFYIDFEIKAPLPNSSVMWDQLLYRLDLLSYIKSDKDLMTILKFDHGVIKNVGKVKYKNHLKRIKERWEHNTGQHYDTLSEFWNNCFFYNIRNSKYYKDLL